GAGWLRDTDGHVISLTAPRESLSAAATWSSNQGLQIDDVGAARVDDRHAGGGRRRIDALLARDLERLRRRRGSPAGIEQKLLAWGRGPGGDDIEPGRGVTKIRVGNVHLARQRASAVQRFHQLVIPAGGWSQAAKSASDPTVEQRHPFRGPRARGVCRR